MTHDVPDGLPDFLSPDQSVNGWTATPTPQQTHEPAPAYVPPSAGHRPPPEDTGRGGARLGWIVALVVVVVVLAVVLATVVIQGRRPQSSTTPLPSPTMTPMPVPSSMSEGPVALARWAGVQITAPASGTVTVADSGVPDIGLVEWSMYLETSPNGWGCQISAVDLWRAKVLWTYTAVTECVNVFPDSDGIVIEVAYVQTAHVVVLDQLTGAIKVEGDLTPGDQVVQVGKGMILSKNQGAGSYCARSMTLGACVWKARLNPANEPGFAGLPAFGDYSWVNTGDGVRYWQTGARAPFGADVKGDPNPNAGFVVYVGASKDHVMRKQWDGNDFTYQQWDPVADAPMGPPLQSGTVALNTAAEVYVHGQYRLDGASYQATFTGYSWQTGQPLWTLSVSNPPDAACPYDEGRCMAGNVYWVRLADASGTVLTTVIGLIEGTIIGQVPGLAPVGATVTDGQATIYTTDGSGQVYPFWANGHDFAAQDLPDPLPYDYQPWVVAGHVVAVSNNHNPVYVLSTQ